MQLSFVNLAELKIWGCGFKDKGLRFGVWLSGLGLVVGGLGCMILGKGFT